MRLREIQAILNRVNFDNLKLPERLSNEDVIYNLQKIIIPFENEISQLKGISIFSENINRIQSSLLDITKHANASGLVRLTNYLNAQKKEDANEFRDRLLLIYDDIYPFSRELYYGALTLFTVLNELLGRQEEHTIDVKIQAPDNLIEISQILGSLHKVFSQTILNEEIKGSITIKNFETGSLWIEILLGTKLAVSLIAGIVWAGTVIYKKIQETKIIEQYITSLENQNESLQNIKDAQEKMLKLMVEIEAKKLLQQHFSKKDDPEQLERIKLAINNFAELIDKGIEICPTLNAPENVKNLFPDMKIAQSIKSEIKEITEGAKAIEANNPPTTP